jgi:hydrogenase nickel incorporation protein HypA/HybF
MHELGVTQEVIDVVLARVNGARVTRIVLEVGRISTFLPDTIHFCFDLCAEGTPLEGTSLEIVETPGIARCRVCNATIQLESIFGYCVCGSADLEWLSGNDVKVTRIDVKTDARN